MKTPERFDKAINSLVRAFLDETLAKGWCTACAVGNIIASSYNQALDKNYLWGSVDCDGIPNDRWGNVFCTDERGQQWRSLTSDVLTLVFKTGYSIEELAKIEFAFETNTELPGYKYDQYSPTEIMEDQYKGLMAVLDVLCEIDNIDLSTKKEYKKMFEYSN